MYLLLVHVALWFHGCRLVAWIGQVGGPFGLGLVAVVLNVIMCSTKLVSPL